MSRFMRTMGVFRSFKAAGGVIYFVALVLAGVASGDEGHDHAAAPHGGVMAKSKRHQFEVVFRKDGLAVYPSGPDGKPLDAARLSGTATFYHPNSPQPWFSRPIRAGGAGATGAPLALSLDLSKVPTTSAKVVFEVSGLSDPAETTATFTVPFALSGVAGVTFAKATAADQGAIAAQKVCPVSGEALGSMGGPIKATRGNRSIFLCCKACEAKILADPDKFFPAALTVAKATAADRGAIAAQKVCPVSGEALGSMGGPIKATRGDRSIFLCCPACVKKVQADPDKFLGPSGAAAAKDGRAPAR